MVFRSGDFCCLLLAKHRPNQVDCVVLALYYVRPEISDALFSYQRGLSATQEKNKCVNESMPPLLALPLRSCLLVLAVASQFAYAGSCTNGVLGPHPHYANWPSTINHSLGQRRRPLLCSALLCNAHAPGAASSSILPIVKASLHR